MIYTFGGVASATLGPGGAGFAIVELVTIAAFGSLSYYIASALSQGQIASMIKLVTVFSCIYIVISSVTRAIGAVAKAFGVGI